jgi:hypothetical protein
MWKAEFFLHKFRSQAPHEKDFKVRVIAGKYDEVIQLEDHQDVDFLILVDPMYFRVKTELFKRGITRTASTG